MQSAGRANDSHHTQIQVAVVQLIHQNAPLFQRMRRQDRFLSGSLLAPPHCGIRAGPGHFLFTGRVRLGKATLRCAPFYKDWLRIARMAECGYG